MSLPKLKQTLFEIEIPSTGQLIKYRQMLVSDEKILLMAKSSEDDSDIYRAVKQVVNNCIIDDIDIDSLATFDIEYLFIKIRAVSIGNVIDITIIDNSDDQEYKFFVDLDEIEVIWPDADRIITITENSGIELKYPPASLFDDRNALNTGHDGYEYLAAKSISKIIADDSVYDTEDTPVEEVIEYLQSLDTKTYGKIKEFLNNLPRLKYVIEYTTKEGEDRKIELNTLSDFFTFW